MSFWVVAVSGHTPLSDRAMAEIEAAAQKPRGKRPEGRNGRLAKLAVLFGEDGGVRRYVRGAAWGYMWREEAALSCSVRKVHLPLKYIYSSFHKRYSGTA